LLAPAPRSATIAPSFTVCIFAPVLSAFRLAASHVVVNARRSFAHTSSQL
jgi:hypothetical protein